MSYKVEMRTQRKGSTVKGDWHTMAYFEHDNTLENDFSNALLAQVAIGREQDWDRANAKNNNFDYKIVEDADDELMRLRKFEDDVDSRIKYQQDGILANLQYLKEYALKGDRGQAEMHLENVLGRVQEVKLLENLKKGIV